MANFNKVILVGRLTRDPETRSFPSGGMVAAFGFAVTNRKKNAQTGQWEDEPMFIDCEAFNRGDTGKQADLVRDRLRKGSQVLLEGKLKLDTWQDKTTGQNRSKHKLVVDNFQFLDPRQDGMGGGGGMGEEDGMGGGGYSPPQRSQAVSRPPAGRPAAPPPKNTYTPPADDFDGEEKSGDEIRIPKWFRGRGAAPGSFVSPPPGDRPSSPNPAASRGQAQEPRPWPRRPRPSPRRRPTARSRPRRSCRRRR